MRRIIKPLQIEAALEEIYYYSAEHWGLSKADRYHNQFTSAFDALAKDPSLGHRHSEIPDPYRAYAAGGHLVIYHADAETLYIVAVLHASMDISDRLDAMIKSLSFYQ